jgi:NAD(P)-dependent dehydrogenase (short-subunit alcohol dehydrogenase family)
MNKKTLLITGSSTRFGHATAKLFADKGGNVVATMRDVSAAGDLAGRDNVLVSRLDVTDPASIDRTVGKVIPKAGCVVINGMNDDKEANHEQTRYHLSQ